MAQPYYKKSRGLRFSCTRCGTCCTRPGRVYFPPVDLEQAATYLSLTPQGFVKQFKLIRIEGILALEPPDGAPCPFYDDTRGCTIYEARPTQCGTWPFWPEVVGGRASWEAAAVDCPGMGRGRLHGLRGIEDRVEACEARLPKEDPWT